MCKDVGLFNGRVYVFYIKRTNKLCLGIAFVLSVALQPNSVLDGLVSEVSRSHTIRHTHNQ
jgi:hypothetical protein